MGHQCGHKLEEFHRSVYRSGGCVENASRRAALVTSKQRLGHHAGTSAKRAVCQERRQRKGKNVLEKAPKWISVSGILSIIKRSCDLPLGVLFVEVMKHPKVTPVSLNLEEVFISVSHCDMKTVHVRHPLKIRGLRRRWGVGKNALNKRCERLRRESHTENNCAPEERRLY
jgi:hypothetical protein